MRATLQEVETGKLVVVRSLLGMWGGVTDPGEWVFTEMVREALTADGHQVDFNETQHCVVDEFKAAPKDAIRIGFGSSLGANNIVLLAVMARQLTFHGFWGFQPSDYGARARKGTTYEGITPNVLFAHCVYNPNVLETGGLGAYEWELAPGNQVTNLYCSKRYDFHPGETPEVERMFLAEIRRVIEAGQKAA